MNQRLHYYFELTDYIYFSIKKTIKVYSFALYPSVGNYILNVYEIITFITYSPRNTTTRT